MKHFSSLIFLILLILVFACTNDKPSLTFEPIDFKVQSAQWDRTPYKFHKFIQDSITKTLGQQYAAWEFASIGDYEQTLKAWDFNAKPYDTLSQEDIDVFKAFKATDAIPHILKKAKNHDVTIINEAHHMPKHRVFTTQLLEKLYEQGYRHLGLEGMFLNKVQDSLIHINKYPTLKNGFYTKEPQFGNLLREALKIGYTLFPYEANDGAFGKERERQQAEHIMEYIKEKATGKVLIHCGFAHATEGEYGGSWEQAMAERLKGMLNNEVLTINQTSYDEKSEEHLENPYRQFINIDKPSVFINDKGDMFGQYRPNTWFDVYVFHPRTKKSERPKWMTYDNRKTIAYDLNDIAFDCPCIVMAFKDGEEIGSAIPYDVQEINDKTVHLVLAKGKYNVVIYNDKNEQVQTKIEVK